MGDFNNKIENKIVYIRYITLNMKRHYSLNVKMLNYYIYLFKWINFKNYNCVPIWLSDFQRNQSEILIILPNLILKNCNKLIAKNIVSVGSQTSCIPCEHPKPLEQYSL